MFKQLLLQAFTLQLSNKNMLRTTIITQVHVHLKVTQAICLSICLPTVEQTSLSIPRLNGGQQGLSSSITVGAHKPIVVFSTVAYAHGIHTFFYYA